MGKESGEVALGGRSPKRKEPSRIKREMGS